MTRIFEKTQSFCGGCKATKLWLKKHGLVEGVDYVLESAEDNLDMLAALGAQEAPVVVPDGAPVFTGFRPDSLKALFRDTLEA